MLTHAFPLCNNSRLRRSFGACYIADYLEVSPRVIPGVNRNQHPGSIERDSLFHERKPLCSALCLAPGGVDGVDRFVRLYVTQNRLHVLPGLRKRDRLNKFVHP